MHHKEDRFFQYEYEKPDAKPNTLSDWQRIAKNPPAEEPTYLIKVSKDILREDQQQKQDKDGFIDIRELINTGNPFAYPEDLKEFFKTYLLCHVKNEDEKKALAELMYLNFHQRGIQHIIGGAIFNHLSTKKHMFSESSYQIKFTPTQTGVLINETNTYTEIVQKSPFERHPQKPYHAKVESTIEITKDCIKLTDLKTDCKSDLATSLLDRRSIIEWIMDGLRNFLGFTPPEDETEKTIAPPAQ